MSLNGLDDPTILSEYQSAVDEPNRWFLLQYVARDAIALLSSGGGGPPELRSAVEEYSEVKPLFGFIHFHSRKIVLKIVPDGTSRLFLARLSVQFSSVLDTFPHDVVYEASSPQDLDELAIITALFPEELTLKPTPLEDIREDEGPKPEDEVKEEPRASNEKPPTQPQPQPQPQPRASRGERHARDRSLASETTSTTHTRASSLEPSQSRAQRQPSIRSLRSTSSWSRDFSFFTGMFQSPKKLQRKASMRSATRSPGPGSEPPSPPPPRPKPVARIPDPLHHRFPRSRTSSETSNNSSKVSLPPNVRPMNSLHISSSERSTSSRRPSRNDLNGENPSSRGSDASTGTVPNLPTLPMGHLLSPYSHSRNSSLYPPPPGTMNSLQTMGRKSSASGLSVRSASSATSAGTRSTAVTPEKQRLMKALNHRKKMQEEEEKREKERSRTVVPDEDTMKADNQDPYTHYMVPSNPGITLPVIVDVDNHGNNPQGRGFPSTDCKPRHNCCHPRIAQTVPATLRLHSKPGTPTAGDPGSACSDKVTDPDEFGNDEMAAVEKLAACCRHLQGQHQDHRVAEEGIVAGNSETSCHGSPPAKPAVTTIDACEMKPGSSAITLTASLNHSTPHCHCHCHWPQASRPQSKTKGQGSSTVPVPDFLRVQSDRRTGQPTITITGTTAKFTNISPLTSASSVLQSPSPYIPVFLASLGHGPSQTIVHKSAHGQASVLTPEGQNTPRDFAAFTNPPASEQPPPPPPPQPRLSFSTATNPHSQLFTPASTSIHSGILHSRPPSVSTSGTGDDSVLADDALMDELSSAAVLEATSVPVITSPPTSPPIGVFAESPKSPQSPMSPQTLSSGTNGPLAATDPPDSQPLPPVRRPTTSQSNASLHESAANGSGSAAAGLARKVTVSSGISKRIEALKMMSNNNGGGNPAPNRLSPHAHQSPAAMERFRKRASDNYTSRPMTSNSNEPLVHQRRLSFVPAEHLRGGVPAASQRLAPETRAFTLPIPFSPAGREESTNNAASGMRSPIQRPATSAAASAKELDRGSSLTRTPSSASLSVRSPNVDPLTGLRRPETASPATTVATSTSDETTGPATLPQPDRPQSPEQKVQQADEVMSPTPNIMRRVTSMGQGIAIHNRRTSVASIISNFNLPSPTATEPEQPSITPIQQEPEPTPVPAAKPQPAQALEIGEVNVQFPDTLLWKRRDMRVDEEGYLHLTAQPIGTSSFVPAPKKYHMSTFQVPRIPDLDEQELPNSVVLAFVGDVSSLQFACQSRQGQEGLHKVLVQAHSFAQHV